MPWFGWPWRQHGNVSPRWVVVDVETTGLDPRRDRLLAIAAVAVCVGGERPRIDIADSFEVVLRHQAPAPDEAGRDNILLHGIGVGAQGAGVEPEAAMRGFAGFVAGAPLLGFHVGFDRAVLERQARALALPSPASAWLDIEPLAAVLWPQTKARSLDEWMAALDVHCANRHRASADVLATAEVLLKLWPRLSREVPAVMRGDVRGALALAGQRRWVGQ